STGAWIIPLSRNLLSSTCSTMKCFTSNTPRAAPAARLSRTPVNSAPKKSSSPSSIARAVSLTASLANFCPLFLACLIQPNGVKQVLEARIAAQRIEEEMHFQELHNVRLPLAGPLKPDKRLLVISEPQISVDERSCRNIACLAPFLQFCEQLKRFIATS